MQHLDLCSGQVFFQLPALNPIVDISKFGRRPEVPVCIGVDDEQVATWTYDTHKLLKRLTWTHGVMEQHVAHGNIDGCVRERQPFSNPFPQGNMLVACGTHLLVGTSEHSGGTIHPNYFPGERRNDLCQIACPGSHVKHAHSLLPGEQLAQPLLEIL